MATALKRDEMSSGGLSQISISLSLTLGYIFLYIIMNTDGYYILAVVQTQFINLVL